ncbi:MAG: class I SAM-dependent methyltransferase [Syntrophorhabdales bacterium]|jgi:SAM-dependent methyltransferase
MEQAKRQAESTQTELPCRIVKRKNDAAGSSNGARGVTSRLFWEDKAPGYPHPFEEDILSFTEAVSGIIEERCLSIKGAKILDIGCGTGAFALPLALQGASVTALDISENMLKRLTAEAQHRGIHGVKTIRDSWKKIDPHNAGLSGRFDVVLSALSIAVGTKKDILKMEECSKQWCICIASGKIRRSALCEQILRVFRAPLNPRPDIRKIRETLEDLGRTFSYESFAVTEREKKTPVQLAEGVAKRLAASGKIPNRPRILATILALFNGYVGEDSAIECELSSDMGILMWRPDRTDYED